MTHASPSSAGQTHIVDGSYVTASDGTLPEYNVSSGSTLKVNKLHMYMHEVDLCLEGTAISDNRSELS